MKEAIFILYVRNQWKSARFYKELLQLEPRLHEPGMTEFELPCGGVLGLMPVQNIQHLLGDKLPDLRVEEKIPRAELYLLVHGARDYHLRALALGGTELNPLRERAWGHRTSYCLDPDGHVIAFAEKLE